MPPSSRLPPLVGATVSVAGGRPSCSKNEPVAPPAVPHLSDAADTADVRAEPAADAVLPLRELPPRASAARATQRAAMSLLRAACVAASSAILLAAPWAAAAEARVDGARPIGATVEPDANGSRPGARDGAATEATSAPTRAPSALHAGALAGLFPSSRAIGGRVELALNPGAPVELRIGALGFAFQQPSRDDSAAGLGLGVRAVGCLGEVCRVRPALGVAVAAARAGDNVFGAGLGELLVDVRLVGPLAAQVGAVGATFDGSHHAGTPFAALLVGWHGLFASAGAAVQGPFVAAGASL